MDSKLFKTALISLICILLLILAVVLHNHALTNGKQEESLKSASAQNENPQDKNSFLSDADFFDKTVTRDIGEEKINLALIATSIEKDLRIQVVNGLGEIVTGHDFTVLIKGMDDYIDEDKDGVIHIRDLSPGDYYVSLKDIADYKVPKNPMKVLVKEKVEYNVISDISLLLKTEEDIEQENEDPIFYRKKNEVPELEINFIPFKFQAETCGIDISKWQGDIDWVKVKDAGVKFAIVRSGYRGSDTGTLVKDPYFDSYMQGAASVGIPVGIYFVTQAIDEVEAVEEASAAIEFAKEYKLDYPIFIDTEGAGGDGRADNIDPETRTLVCKAFCETINTAGYVGGIYASKWWLENNLYMKDLDKFFIWLAEYADAPSYTGKYNMWQRSSKGHVDGIETYVDLDIFYNYK